MRDQEIIGFDGAYASIYTQTQELKEEKDATEIGITGLPIPKKKRSPAKQHEFEKKRRKNIGTNVGGEKYKNDVNPHLNPRSVREEVLSHLLDEGFASDEKSAEAIMGAMSEAWIESIIEQQTDPLKTAAEMSSLRNTAFGSKKFQDKIWISPSNPKGPNWDPKSVKTPGV